MKNNKSRLAEILQLQKETGKSYWELTGKPLQQFNSGSDIEALSPHPYTARSIDRYQPFERFEKGKGVTSSNGMYHVRPENYESVLRDKELIVDLPEIDVVANRIPKAVERAIEKKAYKDFIKNYVVSDILSSLEPPKPSKVKIQSEEEWEPIQMYQKGKPSSESKFLRATIGPQSKEIDRVIDYYSKIGYSPLQIAGILGNIAVENPNWDYTTIGAGGAKGMYQMSADMRNAAADFRKKVGKEYSDHAFVDAVLRGDKRLIGAWSKYGADKGTRYLDRDFKNSAEAAIAFENIFERAGKPNMKERIRSAQDAFDYVRRRRVNGMIGQSENDDNSVLNTPIIVVNQLKKPILSQEQDLVLEPEEERPTQNVQVPYRPSFLSGAMEQFKKNVLGFDEGKDNNQIVDASKAAWYMSGGIGIPTGETSAPEHQNVDYVVNTPEIIVTGTAKKMNHSEIVGGKPMVRPLIETYPEFDIITGFRGIANELLPTSQYAIQLNAKRKINKEVRKALSQKPRSLSPNEKVESLLGGSKEARDAALDRFGVGMRGKTTRGNLAPPSEKDGYFVKMLKNQGVDVENLTQTEIKKLHNIWENSVATDRHVSGNRAIVDMSSDARSPHVKLYDGTVDVSGEPIRIGGLSTNPSEIIDQQIRSKHFRNLEPVPNFVKLSDGVHFVQNDQALRIGELLKEKRIRQSIGEDLTSHDQAILKNKMSHLQKGVSEQLYNTAIVAKAEAGNNTGLYVGANLLSPDKTLRVYQHYPHKIKFPNTGMRNRNNGDLRSPIGPSYLLLNPTQNTPYYQSYLNLNNVTDFGEILTRWNKGKSDIHIKPSHKGRFTEYLKSHPGMTAEKASRSSNEHVRKMAQFALNARKWNR